MLDKFDRDINYLRISIIDRCNLSCNYCKPDGCINKIEKRKILSFEEIVDFVKCAIDIGFSKFRLTGGEPLVRKNVLQLVEILSKLKGVEDLSMTTNGVLLSKYAADLKEAGLHRVNISLDTLNRYEYKNITGFDYLDVVIKGIYEAKRVGLTPIKLNCVIEEWKDKDSKKDLIDFSKRNGFDIRFIKKMDLKKGKFWVVDGGSGGNCPACNRIRLSSDGMVYPCLFSDLSFSVRRLGAKKALLEAIANKPLNGHSSRSKSFYSIGG